MAINLVTPKSTYNESSSDDECLSDVKRKVEVEDGERGIKIEQESDDDSIMAGVLVTVEVKEFDGDCSLPFNKSVKSKKKNKKKQPQEKIKKGRTFSCNGCDAKFDNFTELKNHSLEHQVKTRHKCEICNRYFKKAFSLRMHSKVHMEKTDPQCPLCGLKFSQKSYLSRHMDTHERTIHCQFCKAKFHTPAQLTYHVRHMHIRNKNKNSTKSNDDANQMEHSENTQSDQDESSQVKPFLFSEYKGSLKREDLNHATHCAIVNKMHKGRSVADICKLYNLTPEIVSGIWEDREKYALPKKVAKPSTRFMNNILDTKILDWFKAQKSNGIQVTGQMLQNAAEAFAKECGFLTFNGSKKWLDRFKKRYNISFRGLPKRERRNHMESKWKNHFFREQWGDVRLGIPDEDIYTADEFGFYYNPSKGRIKKFTGKKYIQGYVKDRLAVFLCANMPGTDKKKLLVCGTEDPLLHSYRNPDSLPVTYIRHSKAHFTTQMFEEYVKYWNRELQLQNRTAILVLDRATIHSKLQLSHLKLVFVPWKASNGLIPMKNGVSSKFRDEFRRLMIEEKAMNVLRGVDRNVTCLEALYMLEKSWERVSPEAITKSFVDTGYDVTVPEEVIQIEKPKISENDEEILCNMLKDYDVENYFTDVSSLDQYLRVDEELVTGQGTNVSVFGGNHKADPLKDLEEEKKDILPLGTEKPESEEKEVLVRKSRALQDLDIVKKYLQSNATSYDTYCCFMEIEKFIMQTVMN